MQNRCFKTTNTTENPFLSHVLHEYTAQEQRPNNIHNNVNAPIFMSKQE